MADDISKLHVHGPIYVASSQITCWKCRKATPVHALFATDLEEFEPEVEPWRVEAMTFFWDAGPKSLPNHVVAALARLAQNFQPTYSRTVGATNWANVCIHCKMLQGAFFLHQEPDGPFFGGPDEFKGTKAIVSERGFDLDGASYSM